MSRLEPAEDDQTYNIVYQYEHKHCNIENSASLRSQLRNVRTHHALVGGVIGEYSNEKIRGLNYKAFCAYASNTIPKNNDI